jgi:hypothetical protein
MKHWILIVAGLAGAAPALAAPPTEASPLRAEEARIPFAQFGRIRTFRTAGEDVIYLQDQSRRWYRATLNGPCIGIERAISIGVDQRYSSTFDNSSVLIVEGQRCSILSLVRSAEPPRRPRN